ncbi:MAG: hypothetical protein K2Q22_04855, partial [Cytophagales bacterium]|nr:hypothetical protein [Cytophagales bacterium]
MPTFTCINPVDVFKNNFPEHISAKLSYWDSDLVLRYGNSIFFDQYPQKADELTGKVTMSQLWGDAYSMVFPYVQKAMRGEKQVFDYEYSLSSDALLCTQYCFCPEIEFGKVVGIYSSENDISRYKKMEKDLKQYNRIIGEQNDRLKNFVE